jgi:Flp pilus assembly pilin Flp
MLSRHTSARCDIKQGCNNESGASLVEYALLITLIAAVVAIAVTQFGAGVSGLMLNSTQQITNLLGN